MKRVFWFVVAAIAVSLAGCGSAPQGGSASAAEGSGDDTGVLVDSKTKDLGVETPDWAASYRLSGVRGVERLDGYNDVTVFVGEETGTNLQGLQAWGRSFSANALIAARLKTDFERIATAAEAGSTGSTTSGAPPANFDNYMEALQTVLTSTTFSGARQEADWWGKYRYYKSDGKTVDREEYRYFILVTMEKSVWDRQFEAMLSGAANKTYTNTAEKNRAIELVRNGWTSGR